MQLIDAEYVAGRFLVRVRLPDGSMIRLNADTGGGLTIDPQVSAKLPRYEHGLETDLEAVRFAVEPSIEFGRDFAFVVVPAPLRPAPVSRSRTNWSTAHQL